LFHGFLQAAQTGGRTEFQGKRDFGTTHFKILKQSVVLDIEKNITLLLYYFITRDVVIWRRRENLILPLCLRAKNKTTGDNKHNYTQTLFLRQELQIWLRYKTLKLFINLLIYSFIYSFRSLS
jgi:hypothetical protein